MKLEYTLLEQVQTIPHEPLGLVLATDVLSIELSLPMIQRIVWDEPV